MALPSWMQKTLLISAFVITAFVIAALVIIAQFRQHAVSPDQLSLGTTATRIKGKKGFSFMPPGGAKTQYAAKNADSTGGYYFVECEKGKVTAIYVTYEKPVSRSVCLSTMQRIAGNSRVIETDSSELVLPASPPANVFLEPIGSADQLSTSEYFYFENGNYAEMQYLKPSSKGISRLIGYLGS